MASSASTSRKKPAMRARSPPSRRPSPPPTSTSPTLPNPARSAFYHTLFPSSTQLISSSPSYNEEKTSSPPTSPSPPSPSSLPPHQLLSLHDLPVIQRENLRLRHQVHSLHSSLTSSTRRAEEWREGHAAEVRATASQVQHLQFLYQQSKAMVREQQQTIDGLKERVEARVQVASTPSLVLNSTLEPSTSSPPSLPPSILTSSSSSFSSEVRLLSQQVSSLQSQLSSLTSSNTALSSENRSLSSKLLHVQSDLKRVKEGKGAGEEVEETGDWGGYVDALKGKELHLEHRKLQAQVDYLNEQRAKAEAVIAAYERKGGVRPGATPDGRIAEEVQRAKARVKEAEGEAAALKARVESMEVDLFTSQEAELVREERHKAETIALTRSIDALKEELHTKSKAVEAHQSEVAALRLHFQEREERASSEWMQRHRVKEMADRIDEVTRQKKEVEEELRVAKLRAEEATAEVLLLQGRFEEEAVKLRRDVLDKDEERRRRDEELDRRHSQLSSLSLQHKKAVADLTLAQKQLGHSQTELLYYREKLREVEAKGRLDGDDELQLRLQAKLKGEEAEAAKAELDRLKAERVKAVDEGHALSLLVHSLQMEVKDKDERLHQLQVQLDLSLQSESRHRQAQSEAAEYSKEEAERVIRRQREQVERVKVEMESLYEKMRSVHREKADAYEMLKLCDVQLSKVQLELSSLQQEKVDLARSLQHEKETVVRVEAQSRAHLQEKERVEAQVESMKGERDEAEHGRKEAEYRVEALKADVEGRERELSRVKEEFGRKESEVQLVLRREAESVSRYWEKEREVREVRARVGQVEWSLSLKEKEEVGWREERARLQRQVEEVDAVIKHMDALSFARDEEVKALLKEVEGYKAELMRRLIAEAELKDAVEEGVEKEAEMRRGWKERSEQWEEERREASRVQEELELVKRRLDEWEGGEEGRLTVMRQLEGETRAVMGEKERVEAELHRVRGDGERCESEMQRLQEEALSLTSDLQLLLKENAGLSGRLGEMRAREVEREVREGEMRERVEELEGEATVREREKMEVVREWRVACLELDRLRTALREEEGRVERMREEEAKEEDTRRRSSMEAAKLSEERRRLRVEVEGWKAQNEELARLLELERKEVVEVREEVEGVRRELKAAKAVNASVEGMRGEGQRREAEMAAALKEGREEREKWEREREEHRRAVDHLKARVHQLESSLQQMRREEMRRGEEAEAAVEEKVKSVNQLHLNVAALTRERATHLAHIQRLTEEKEAFLRATSGGGGAGASSVHELTRLLGLVESLEKEKEKMRGYLLRYEAEVHRLERERKGEGRGGGAGKEEREQKTPQR